MQQNNIPADCCNYFMEADEFRLDMELGRVRECVGLLTVLRVDNSA
jgi:hypothetical protein